MKVIQPPALQSGDTVGIVSPAGPPDPLQLDRGARFLSQCGFKVVLGNSVLKQNGYLAGNDSDRTKDINTFIADPKIKAIFCSKGGYGSARLLSSVDYSHLLSDPKILIGFSDLTALLQAITVKTGLITFHGPLIANPHSTISSLNSMIQYLSGKQASLWPNITSLPTLRYLNETPMKSPVRGILFGGCLTLIVSLIGTPYMFTDHDLILFLEETGEAPYRIDRMLTHLINSGALDNCRGVILGQFIGCVQRESDREPTPSTREVILERFSYLKIPTFEWEAFGHGSINMTIPIGCPVSVSPDRITQEIPAVI